jgi:hypothetical protein
VDHQVKQLFNFSLEAQSFFFGNSHVFPRGKVGLNGLLAYGDGNSRFKAVHYKDRRGDATGVTLQTTAEALRSPPAVGFTSSRRQPEIMM